MSSSAHFVPSAKPVRTIGAFAALLLVACLAAPVRAQVSAAECGDLSNGNNGPFDYRVERGAKLRVVEDFHFNAKVENLLSGQSGYLGQDLEYVLRVFPNHHRALAAVARLSKREKAATIAHTSWPAECFFERSVRFRPDDTVARMLYANFLHQSNRSDEGVRQLEAASQLARDNGFTQHNVGLLYAEFGIWDRALSQAHLAKSLGFERPDLKQRIVAAGKWVDPIADGPDAAASAPAASNSK